MGIILWTDLISAWTGLIYKSHLSPSTIDPQRSTAVEVAEQNKSPNGTDRYISKYVQAQLTPAYTPQRFGVPLSEIPFRIIVGER